MYEKVIKLRIYFVRHGQTNLNKQRLIQGRIDEPLNKLGIRQAKQTGQLLKNLKFDFDKLVSSPLSRAFETAHWISVKMNYKDNILVNNKLVERDFGNYDYETIADTFPTIMEPGFKEAGFESSDILIPRIKSAIAELYVDYKNKTIIATVHAHVIRSAYILSDPKKYTFTNFFLGNCSIHVFDYDGSNFQLVETHNNEE